MSVLQDYSIIYDRSENYILNFTTTEKTSATYSTDRDGTNVITLVADAKGTISFSKNYGNTSKNFKFGFEQQGITNTSGGGRIPSGDITGG